MWTPRTIWPAPPGASCSLSTSIANCKSLVKPAGVRMPKFFGSSSSDMSTIVPAGCMTFSLEPEQLFGVAAGEGCDGRCVKAFDARNVADGIKIRHVIGIIGAHDDVVGAEHTDQFGKLVRREHHRVDIDAFEIRGRRLRQRAMGIRTCAPGMIDTARIPAEIAAAM